MASKIVIAVATFLQTASAYSGAAAETAWAAKSASSLHRSFAVDCGEARYEFEFESRYSDSSLRVELLTLKRTPVPMNDWMIDTIAATLKSYSDIYRFNAQCGYEKDGEPAQFLSIDLGGNSTSDISAAISECDERAGMFDIETRRRLLIDDEHVEVISNEIGTCTTADDVEAARRLNEEKSQ